jgi:hypothetical protein
MPLIINELTIEVPAEPNQVAGDSQPVAASDGDASLAQLREALALAQERRERLDLD